MKGKITDEIRTIFDHGRQWVELEVEYAKLTVAEKVAILSSAMVLGFVSLLLLLLIMILLSFALVGVFEQIMSPALSYLSVAGIVLLIIVLIALLRKPLITDPIARFITRLLLDRKEPESNENKEVEK